MTKTLLLVALAVYPLAQAQSVKINSIEVNQALGQQLNGRMNFTAGKDTIVRAILAAPVTVTASTTNLVIQKDGQTVATLAPNAGANPVSVVEFPCPTRDACGAWAAGSYVFTATVNGTTLSTTGTAYSFATRGKLRILVRPVKANYAGTVTTVQGDKWKTAWQYLSKVYPVAADQIQWDVREEFDASASSFDLETDAGQRALWDALTNQMPKSCAANPKAAGCYDLIVGFISDRPNTYPNGKLQGYTMGRPTNIVVASDQDMEATVAHEIAHTFGAGDTYTGGSIRCSVNPAPDTTAGKDWDNPSNPAQCKAGKVVSAQADATGIPATLNPYDVGGRGLLPDMADFMGSGGPQAVYWVTPEVYAAVYDGLVPVVAAPSQSASKEAAAVQRLLNFSGFIDASNNVSVDPWWAFQSTELATDTTGAFQVQAVDSTGAVVASQAINPQFLVHTNPPRVVTEAPFEGAIRFPASAAKFQVVNGTKVLYEIKVTANDPVVSNVTPTLTGTTISGAQTITWVATDADGDALTYLVEYSVNPSDPTTWITLGDDLTTRQWQDDFSQLPGSKAAQIRVTATDGLRTGVATSQPFIVPFKAPAVAINPPASTVALKGTVVELSGEAEDLQDSIVAPGNLAWTSSVDGKLGNGLVLKLSTLSVGTHVITLTAINSVGLSGSDSITLTIAPSATPAQVATIANAASGAQGPIAAGELITIKGTNLGPTTGTVFTVDKTLGTVAGTLGGTRVLIGGFAAPITYTSATQINAIVPYEVAGLTKTSLVVEVDGVQTSGTSLTVASAAPGAFTFDSTGSGPAVAANQDGSFNGPTSAAAKGSYVTIYFTGGGQSSPAGVTGSVNSTTKLKYLAGSVSVTVGGQPAVVAFAGAAPGFVDGVNQLNIQLSSNTPTGAQPLVITVAGNASVSTATLTVK